MITPGADLKVYVATRPVDFRKGHDGLAALVQQMFGLDPFSGAAFVFRAKRADRVGHFIRAKHVSSAAITAPSSPSTSTSYRDGSGSRSLTSWGIGIITAAAALYAALTK